MSSSLYTRLLLLLALAIFLLPFLLGHPLVLGLVQLTLAAVLVSAVWQSGTGLVLRGLATALALLYLGVNWLPIGPSPEIRALAHGSAAAFLVVVATFITRNLWEQRRVGADAIIGALAGYLLLGLIWSAAYALVEVLIPGSFRGLETAWIPPEGVSTEPVGSIQPQLLYFSFVTLTTLGYGDLSPGSPVAASLSVLEAVVGQLYIAVLIARLVALSTTNESDTL